MGPGLTGPTEKQLTQIEAAMKAGAGYTAATGIALIPHRTAYRWKAAGQRELADGLDTPLSRLAAVAERAYAHRVARAESYVHRAQDLDDEKLSARDKISNAHWILSRLAREDYGDRTEIQIRGELEGVCEAVKPHMSTSAFKEMILAFATVAGMDPGSVDGADHEEEDPLPLH